MSIYEYSFLVLRVALRAAENVINEIAKGTRKRPGKTTQVQVLEDEEPEPDIQEEAHAEQEGLGKFT